MKGDVVEGNFAHVQSADCYKVIALADLASFDSLTAWHLASETEVDVRTQPAVIMSLVQ